MLHLSDQQGQAVKAISDEIRQGNRSVWLAGFAGSGKTSIAPHLVEASKARKPLYIAPTNKAARVLSSKLDATATSIHKAIYFPPDKDEQNGQQVLTWEVCPDAPASAADLILVDEASMVGSKVGKDLASFGVPIIAIGDPGQLPPVKDDPYFCHGDPDFMLTEIHRQASDNPIIQLSQDIREGKRLSVGTMGDKVRIASRGDVDIDTQDLPQVITGTHKRRWSITSVIRDVLGYEGWLPNPHEPLICKKNSRDHNLINGMMCQAITCSDGKSVCKLNLLNDAGQCLEVDASTQLFEEQAERFRANRTPPKYYELFDFAHAITCHSAQGSQWDHVLVYDEGYVFREEEKRWLYTAVTRAADRLTVIKN